MTKIFEKYETLISRLETKLDDNIKTTNNNIKKIDKILEILNDNQKELNRQHHDLYGNGKKGLFDEVEELKTKTKENIERTKKEINDRIIIIKKDVDNNSHPIEM